MAPANRGVSGRFIPGHSGNPQGRPKGFAALVREETREGGELVAHMLAVLRNPAQPEALRMQAAAWLADRGWGKPTQSLEASVSMDVDTTVTHVDALRATIRERLSTTRTTSTGPTGPTSDPSDPSDDDVDARARRLLG